MTGDTPDKAGWRVGVQVTAPELAGYRFISAVENGGVVGDLIDTPGMLAALRDQAAAVSAGDLGRAEAMLMTQATALQSLSARLIERGVTQQMLPQFETFMRLALKAQAQSRQTLETLAAIKQGPAIFARQANVAAGAPMQVNNGLPAPSDARQIENPQNQLSGRTDELHPHGSTPRSPIGSDPSLEALGALKRPADS